ncbi:uncharacterized protein RHO25_001736 [Cercospora beticola]|nr:hypothetical protein RHO25_001736 [Cercospora beticola]
MRTLASPLLFEKICLGRSWGPEHMIESLKALRQSEDALKAARELHIDLWPEPDRAVPPGLLDELGSLLLECMASMNRLTRISLSTTPSCSESMRETFEQAGSSYPQVKELVVGSHSGWLISYCPNVERIFSDDWLVESLSGHNPLPDFLQAAGQATELREFSCNALWDIESVQLAYQHMPQLRSLGIRGRISPPLQEMITILRKFRYLRSLALPEASMLAGLNIGECSFVNLEDSAAQASALVTIFEKLRRLEEVRLGRHFRAWTSSEAHRPGRITLQWEMNPGFTRLQTLSCSRATIHWETDDASSLTTIDDDLEAILSTAEDSASIFSRADTLAF